MRYEKGVYGLKTRCYFRAKNLPKGEENFEGSVFLRYYAMSTGKSATSPEN
jgi:hypothetical protein